MSEGIVERFDSKVFGNIKVYKSHDLSDPRMKERYYGEFQSPFFPSIAKLIEWIKELEAKLEE